MPKFVSFVVLFLIIYLNNAWNGTEASDSDTNYVIVALDEWDMNNNTELRQILMSLRQLDEGRSGQNSALQNDGNSESNFYENVIIVLDGMDDDMETHSPLQQNVTGRAKNREEIRGIIWNPRKIRERRRKLRAAYSQLNNLEECWERHDTCEGLNTNEIKYTLKNEAEQRFWHCNCELEFYNCLHLMNTTLSNHIGELYFNHNHRCYRLDHEVQKCREYDSHRGGPFKRCVQYLLYLNTEMKNQWFDLPYYSGKPMKSPLFTMRKIK